MLFVKHLHFRFSYNMKLTNKAFSDMIRKLTKKKESKKEIWKDLMNWAYARKS